MPTAYILIGVQGSGKSIWAHANAGRLNAVVLASDEIRNELEAQGIDATNEGDRVFATVEARLGRLLDEGQNVIVDATHARVRWREKEVAVARRRGAKVIAVWFDVPLGVAIERNAGRPGGPWGERVVPKNVLLGVAHGFQPPISGEFDEVWRLRK
ncbi:MAG: AAA family ATPase [Anaerolineales bacterium]